MRLWRRSATDIDNASRVAPIAFRKPSAARSPPTLRILSLNTGSYSTQWPSPSTIGWSIFERTCSGVIWALMTCSEKVATLQRRLCGQRERCATSNRRRALRPAQDHPSSALGELAPRRRRIGRLGRALFGAYQPVQFADRRNHLALQRGDNGLGGQNPVVASQCFNFFTVL